MLTCLWVDAEGSFSEDAVGEPGVFPIVAVSGVDGDHGLVGPGQLWERHLVHELRELGGVVVLVHDLHSHVGCGVVRTISGLRDEIKFVFILG